jgi:hypothetical protein
MIVRTLWAPDVNDDRPEESFWLCRNPDCAAELTLPFDDVTQDLAEGRQPECTQCGQRTTTRAVGCPHCKRAYPPVGHSSVREICPHCGERYFQDDEGGEGKQDAWPQDRPHSP